MNSQRAHPLSQGRDPYIPAAFSIMKDDSLSVRHRPVHPWPHSCCVLSHTISDIHMTLKLTVTTHRHLIPPLSSSLCAHPCTGQFREGPGSNDFPERLSQNHKITKVERRFEGTQYGSLQRMEVALQPDSSRKMKGAASAANSC